MIGIPHIDVGESRIGRGFPTFIIAEIGINHNGDIELAKKLIDVAVAAGCNAVKFQKRTPEICVPEPQKGQKRDTPWGRITYLDYRYRTEFGQDEYEQIDVHCRMNDIMWSASCWDQPSLEFINPFTPPFLKVPSAMLTNHSLVKAHIPANRPLFLSTGMSTVEEMDETANLLDDLVPWIFLHCNSTYPADVNEINLLAVDTIRERYGRPVGYSGHEVGLQISLAAVARGANVLERHITLDRAMWGTDQAASIEPQGLHRLVRDIRIIENALGDGTKRVYESELPVRAKLRGVKDLQ